MVAMLSGWWLKSYKVQYEAEMACNDMSFILILYKVEYEIWLLTVCMYKSYYSVYFLYTTTKQQSREHPNMKFPHTQCNMCGTQGFKRPCISISVVSGCDKNPHSEYFLTNDERKLNFLIWVLLFFEVLATMYCDINKGSSSFLCKGQELLPICPYIDI
jgi:hypothetical protein